VGNVDGDEMPAAVSEREALSSVDGDATL